MKINEITNIFEKRLDLSSIINAETRKELDYAFQDLSNKYPDDEESIENAYDERSDEMKVVASDSRFSAEELHKRAYDELAEVLGDCFFEMESRLKTAGTGFEEYWINRMYYAIVSSKSDQDRYPYVYVQKGGKTIITGTSTPEDLRKKLHALDLVGK